MALQTDLARGQHSFQTGQHSTRGAASSGVGVLNASLPEAGQIDERIRIQPLDFIEIDNSAFSARTRMYERFPVADEGVGGRPVVEEFGSVYLVFGFGKMDVVRRIRQAYPIPDDQFLVRPLLLSAAGRTEQ
jgi:hypothetical protein